MKIQSLQGGLGNAHDVVVEDSMMPRKAERFGSMFLAKNAAVAILPR